jgi:hypothetical protein
MMMMRMQASPALVSLTVIAVPGCTVGNILLTIPLSKYPEECEGSAPLSDVDSSVWPRSERKSSWKTALMAIKLHELKRRQVAARRKVLSATC